MCRNINDDGILWCYVKGNKEIKRRDWDVNEKITSVNVMVSRRNMKKGNICAC
jgi:hypothetical protein